MVEGISWFKTILIQNLFLISVQTAKKEGEKSTEIVREFKGDEMIQTSKVIGSDLVCTQVFKKQA